MDGRWLLLLVGPFLVVVLTRDLMAAWRHQAFNKGPGQLWTVSRAAQPATFWFLMAANVALVLLGARVTITTAMDLWM